VPRGSFQKGGSVTELPIAQEGASIRSDDRNWLQRFNDKVYSGYQEHKPQLFKDFPITDIVEPVVSYLTGHADAEYGPLIAFTPSMGKMIPKPSKDFNNLYHYSRNPFLDYEDVNLFREGSSQMKSKYRRQANSPEDLPGGFYTTMNPSDGFMGGQYGNKMSIPANAKVKDLAITGRITDRIPIKELKQFRSEGYDIIKGKNMLGQEEWIPLNKNKLFGWEKFNRSDYRSVPRGSFQKGGSVTELPMMKKGGRLEKRGWLDKYQEGGWLDKYQEGGKVNYGNDALNLFKRDVPIVHQNLPEVTVTAERKYPYRGCVEGTARDLSSSLGVNYEVFRKTNNFYGDAWKVLDNMYGEDIDISSDYSNLRVGDVINLSRKPFKSDASKGIPSSNQHIGRVSKVENGIPYVKHYISSDKKYYEEPINNISAFSKYSVTRAKRPDKLKDISYSNSSLRFDTNYKPNQIEKDILTVRKPDLQKSLSLDSSEYDKLERIAYGIMGVESDFGRSKRTLYRMTIPDFMQKIAKVTHDKLRDIDVYDENINNLSQGYGSIKESSLHGINDNTGEQDYNEIRRNVKNKNFDNLERTNNYLYYALQEMGLNPDNLESGANSFKAVMANLAWFTKRFPNITEDEIIKKYTGKKDITEYKKVYSDYLKNIDNIPENNMDYSWLDEALGKASHVANIINNSSKKLNSKVISTLRDAAPVPENVSALFADLLGAKEPITEKSLRSATINKLTEIVRNNIRNGKFVLEYNDYGTSSNKNEDVGGGKSPSISKMMKDEAYILKTMLGQAQIVQVGDNEYEVRDSYDFNDKGKSFGFIDDLKKRGYSPYAIVRSLGRNYGSQDKQGSQVKIRLKI